MVQIGKSRLEGDLKSIYCRITRPWKTLMSTHKENKFPPLLFTYESLTWAKAQQERGSCRGSLFLETGKTHDGGIHHSGTREWEWFCIQHSTQSQRHPLSNGYCSQQECSLFSPWTSPVWILSTSTAISNPTFSSPSSSSLLLFRQLLHEVNSLYTQLLPGSCLPKVLITIQFISQAHNI